TILKSFKKYSLLQKKISKISRFFEIVQKDIQSRAIDIKKILSPGTKLLEIYGNTTIEKLETIGRQIYQELFPNNLKNILKSNKISAIIINSEDYLIPFELMHDGKSFLAIKIEFYRDPIFRIQVYKANPETKNEPIHVFFFQILLEIYSLQKRKHFKLLITFDNLRKIQKLK
ncbi:MAG: hypothetical protein ACFFD2_27115, partial [Promethearchaeota archaeon]